MTSLHSVAHQCAGGLKSEHYPSLELCKRLTEAGFPRTAYGWTTGFLNLPIGEYAIDDTCRDEDYVCPSIAELLDELPKKYSDNNISSYKITIDMKFDEPGATITLVRNGCSMYMEFEGTPPKALAEMWLWLKENNYLPK